MSTGTIKRIAIVGFPVISPNLSPQNLIFQTYGAKHGWEFIANTVASPLMMQTLPELGCDGALVRVTSEAMREACQTAPFPVVNISAWMEHPGVPTIRPDDKAQGVLAAEHLLQKGFRRFGIITVPGGWFIQRRIEGIAAAINSSGGEYQEINSLCESLSAKEISLLANNRLRSPSAEEISQLAKNLKELPLPVGIILTDSKYIQFLFDAAKEASLEIPLDLAIIGINTPEHPLSPSLTLCAPNTERSSLEAVELLDRLTNGHTAEQFITQIPPLGIIQGESSDITYYKDRITAQTVDFVRRYAHEGINATDIADALEISPATLSRHCRKYLGLGAHQYLCKIRIDRAADMLKNHPERTFTDIARAVGIAGYDRFNKVFYRIKKLSPADYRKGMRHTDHEQKRVMQ